MSRMAGKPGYSKILIDLSKELIVKLRPEPGVERCVRAVSTDMFSDVEKNIRMTREALILFDIGRPIYTDEDEKKRQEEANK